MSKRVRAHHAQGEDLFGQELFSESSPASPVDSPPAESVSAADEGLVEQARRSALWAAYGDALGWIAELTDERGLRRRTHGKALVEPVAWDRRIGGRSGVVAHLPLGCYSDDTQLRMATSRAISARGFDVEAFAKVELPVWTTYALGGGRSTKAGATNLVRPAVPWYANTYKGWTDAGGNGVAMRVQPHVWFAHASGARAGIVREVLRNAVCTHGSVIAILGATLHAALLDEALATQSVPSIEAALRILDGLREVPTMMQQFGELGDIWVGLWERATRLTWANSWAEGVDDAIATMRGVASVVAGSEPSSAYASVLRDMRLFDEELRGSGVLTAIAALALCWCFSDPAQAMRVSANALGSDTDTIATMAGAILGAASTERPPVAVMDADLIVAEVDRLFGLPPSPAYESHSYPDLLKWSPPRTQADGLVLDQTSLYVLGLGQVEFPIDDPVWAADGQFGWQWLRLSIGQTVLVKRRRELQLLREEDRLVRVANTRTTKVTDMPTLETAPRREERESARPSDRISTPASRTGRDQASDDLVKLAFQFLERERYNDAAVGRTLRRLVQRGTREEIAAFVAALLLELRKS